MIVHIPYFRRLVLVAAAALAAGSVAAELPSLEPVGDQVRLRVGGKPFLILGGELGNSSASDLNDLRNHWPIMKEMGLNTVVAPVYWDLTERVEGQFDWALLQGLVQQAREQDMKVVVLWFGAWKNSMSCYSPAWVKVDTKRFPRVRDAQGRPQEIVTPWSAELLKADVVAYGALLAEIRRLDPQAATVIAVQVENEIGMLPEARDRSELAEAAWKQPVPQVLIDGLASQTWSEAEVASKLWRQNGSRKSGTWADVFGSSIAAEEVFMAWSYGVFIEQLVKAGKAVHPLPMFVNTALIRPGYQPGQYPSAGPLPHLYHVWRTASPSLDLLTPDIYFPNFAEWAGKYRRPGHPLLIPEALRSPEAAVNALYAFGEHRAIGFSPFGIESVQEPAKTYLTSAYGILNQLKPWLTGEREGASIGLLPESPEARQPLRRQLGGFTFHTTFERTKLPSLADGVIIPIGLDNQTAGTAGPAGGLILQIGPDEFVAAGMGITLTFTAEKGADTIGILEAQEGRFEDGSWRGGRWLNGDQTHQGRHIRLEPGRFSLQRFKLYRYQ